VLRARIETCRDNLDAESSSERGNWLPPAEGVSLHMRFWKLLRCSAPSSALVCPVVLGTRVVNLLYAHPDSGGPIAPEAVEDAVVVCREAADAYARAVRLAR
jgi:hypothetical protein